MKEKFKKHILRLLLAIMIAGISVPAINMIQPQAVEVQAAAKRNGWTKKGRYKYYYKNGKKLTGKRKLGKYYYYFDKKGRMQTGNKKIGRSWYSFDKSGRMRQNKIVFGYYYQKNGVRYTKKNRFVKVSGKYYWVNNKGKCTVKKGWQTINRQRYYLSNKGVPTKGAKKIGKYYYYFDKAGRMQKNKVVSGYFYQFNGRRYTGRNRFVTVNGACYWADGHSRMTIKSGFQNVNGKRRLIANNGKFLNGIRSFGGKVYYAKNTVAVAGAGWVNSGSNRYYFQKGSYTASTGWKTISGKRYYFNKNASMAKNTTIGDYVIGSDGVAKKKPKPTPNPGGWVDVRSVKISKTMVTFAMAKNTTIGDYVIGSDGVAKKKPKPTPNPGGWVDVRSVKISKTMVTFDSPMDEISLSASVEPSNATNPIINWSSSNPKVATVNSNGYVKAAGKEGAAIIAASSMDNPKISASCKIIVDFPEEKPKEPSAELKAALDEITSRDYTMNEMDGRDIIADSRFQFWTNKDDYLMPDADNVCIVTSSSPDIWAEAKPDSNGKYTRLSAFCRSGHYGTTTLTFTLGNYVRACKLTVFKDPGIQWDKISDEELAACTIDRKDYAQEIYRLINDFRVKNGRHELKWDDNVSTKMSAIQAGYNICKGIRVEPYTPERLARHGAAQIGVGSTGWADAQECFNRWINSPLHKANILDKHPKSIGIVFLQCDYSDGIHSRRATTAICSFGGFDPEDFASWTDEEVKEAIMECLNLDIKTESDYYKYMNLFYHPTTPTILTEQASNAGNTEAAEEAIMECLNLDIKTESDYYKYMNLFYHPTTPTILTEQASNAGNTEAADFGDGSSVTTESAETLNTPDVVETDIPAEAESVAESENVSEEFASRESVIETIEDEAFTAQENTGSIEETEVIFE